MTIDEFRTMVLDDELLKQLPLSNEMIDFIVELVRIETTMA
jgi:hypothetical protein